MSATAPPLRKYHRGRPDNPAKAEILRLHAEGRTATQIAAAIGQDRQTVRSVIRRAGLKVNRKVPKPRQHALYVKRTPKPRKVRSDKGDGPEPRIDTLAVERKALVWGLVAAGVPIELCAERAGCTVEEARVIAAAMPRQWDRWHRIGRDH